MTSTSPATNPYTAHLLAQLPPGGGAVAIAAFVADWDRLETLVIRVFRAGAAGAEDAASGRRCASLAAPCRAFDDLAHHWPLTRVAGEPCAVDPFRALVDVPIAGTFVANWGRCRRCRRRGRR
ncbi:MAG: hypothetical protein U0470_06980 [Anaerolineae bacterium]